MSTCVTYTLIGKTGHGKSTTANSLSETSHFVSSDDLDSVTDSVAHFTYTDAEGCQFRVIDTPGVFDTQLSVPELATRLAEFTHISPDGLDAIVCVVRKGRMTDEELAALAIMENLFGSEVWHHAIIVFTHCKDDIATLKERIGKLPETHLLKSIVAKAGNRVAKIDNTSTENCRQGDRAAIHGMILQVMRETGKKYDNKLFERAREKMREVEESMRLVKDKYEEKIKELKASYNKGLLSMEDYEKQVEELRKKQEEYEAQKTQLELESLKRSYETWDAVKDWASKGAIAVVAAGAVAGIAVVAAPAIATAGLGVLAAGGGALMFQQSHAAAADKEAAQARARAEQARAREEEERLAYTRRQQEPPCVVM